MRLIGPLFLLAGVAVVALGWWWGRGNETTGPDPDVDPTPPGPGLVSFSAHPAAVVAPSRDGWVAQVLVDVHTMTSETLTGTAVHSTMGDALVEARTLSDARRRELAA